MVAGTPTNQVKRRLKKDEVASTMVVRLVTSIEIAQVAAECGFDSLYIDMEHSALSMETTSQICMAALATGVAPFVRVPGHGPEYVSRVLDNGALGVIAPHVENASDAEAVVRNAKFPPLGERSVTVGIPHFGFKSLPVSEMRSQLNDETVVVVMIESAEALEQVEEIAAVPGVDIVMIGTNDFCAGLGIDGQFDHVLVADAYERMIAACQAGGSRAGVGGLAGRPDLIAKFVAAGARYVSSGSDLNFILAAGRERAKQIREIPTSSE